MSPKKIAAGFVLVVMGAFMVGAEVSDGNHDAPTQSPSPTTTPGVNEVHWRSGTVVYV
jgi:hypothetical protein